MSTGIEHPAVRGTLKKLEGAGAEVVFVPPGPGGCVSAEAVGEALTLDTLLVTVILAQNETGVLQPVREIAERAHACGAYVHTDAVQAVGKIPVNVAELGVDMLSLAAHKFHGPKGAGALWVKTGTRIGAFVHGGGQEGGLRPGTENVAGIAGLAEALDTALRTPASDMPRVARLRDRLAEATSRPRRRAGTATANGSSNREPLLPRSGRHASSTRRRGAAT